MMIARTPVLVALLAWVGAAAAGQAEAPAPASAAQPRSAALPAHHAPAKHYRTLPQKKNGSGVQVGYRLEGTPAVGQPLTISLQFHRVVASGGAAVRFTTDAGLQLAPWATQPLPLRTGQSNAQQIVVTPQSEGLHYVNVFTEQAGRSSAAAIAVQVGNKAPTMKSLGPVTTDATGEKIISMPAK
ncbi:MAG: hypothetical protein KGQ77_02585 [Betaproteobacteria bacterium]|nr:hypothetical protein [Betaproteobacteria bacterium]